MSDNTLFINGISAEIDTGIHQLYPHATIWHDGAYTFFTPDGCSPDKKLSSAIALANPMRPSYSRIETTTHTWTCLCDPQRWLPDDTYFCIWCNNERP